MTADAITRSYRPANGSEGEWFEAEWCASCQHDDIDRDMFCPILANAMAFSIGDPEYPKEWVCEQGTPICTAFEPWSPDEPTLAERIRCDRTLDMFTDQETKTNEQGNSDDPLRRDDAPRDAQAAGEVAARPGRPA